MQLVWTLGEMAMGQFGVPFALENGFDAELLLCDWWTWVNILEWSGIKLNLSRCGKGTQCQRIVETFDGWRHLSVGNLLRDQVQKGTPIVSDIVQDA